MKTLLIRPFYHVVRSWVPYVGLEPLSLEYLGSSVRNDHEVRILDCIGEYPGAYKLADNGLVHVGPSLEQVRARIMDYKPELVGVTSTFVTQVPCVNVIINLVKEIDSNIFTVVGGVTPSCYPEETLKENPNIDIVVVGEGESTFKELLDKNADNLGEIDGIVYRNKDVITRNKPRQFIRNLDDIPFPSRDLVPFENYSESFSNLGMGGKIKMAIDWIRFNDDRMSIFRNRVQGLLRGEQSAPQRKGNRAMILTSRGCPFNCYYCSIHNVWMHTYRMRSVENVLEELTLLHEKYNVRHVGIQDDNFNLSKKRTIELCKGIMERGLDLTLRADSGVYLPTLDEETLNWMKNAGFNELYFGIESGNQGILDNVINKKLPLDQVKPVAEMCKKIGIRSGGFFMVGVPGETEDTMMDTVKFALTSGLDRVRLYTCQPFPGSRLYDDSKQKGWLDSNFKPEKALIFGSRTFIRTKEFSAEDVNRIAIEGKAKLRKLGVLDMSKE